MALFTIGTGGHYITMLPADWSISTSHDPLPSSCHSEKMLRNPSIHAGKYLTVYAHMYMVRINVQMESMTDAHAGWTDTPSN